MSGAIRVQIQQACTARGIPAHAAFSDWAGAVEAPQAGSVCIRIVDPEEMSTLNHQFRNRPGPTDVLAFPADGIEREQGHLGDLAICASVVLEQAAAHMLDSEEHFAQVTVHGLLHLLGHDHQYDTERAQMQSQEARILEQLGFTNPYVGEEGA